MKTGRQRVQTASPRRVETYPVKYSGQRRGESQKRKYVRGAESADCLAQEGGNLSNEIQRSKRGETQKRKYVRGAESADCLAQEGGKLFNELRLKLHRMGSDAKAHVRRRRRLRHKNRRV